MTVWEAEHHGKSKGFGLRLHGFESSCALYYWCKLGQSDLNFLSVCVAYKVDTIVAFTS